MTEAMASSKMFPNGKKEADGVPFEPIIPARELYDLALCLMKLDLVYSKCTKAPAFKRPPTDCGTLRQRTKPLPEPLQIHVDHPTHLQDSEVAVHMICPDHVHHGGFDGCADRY